MANKPENCYPLSLKIAGIGCYLPKKVVSSKELENRYGLDEGWCEQNLGVTERRWVQDEIPSFMGAQAAGEALANADMDADDIDLLISASGTAVFERGLPDAGPLIQKKLGLETSGIPSFTMQNNDLSFMTALDTGAAFLNTGRYETILVVSSEIFSRNLDESNPHVSTLFGDGAAAAVLTLPGDGEVGDIQTAHFATYGSGAAYLESKLGLAAREIEAAQAVNLTLKMDETAFVDAAKKAIAGLLDKLPGKGRDDIVVIIPPQAGTALSGPVRERFPGEKLVSVYDRFGFCGAASVPLALHQAVKQENLTRGSRFLMLGVGAGLSVGSMVLTY